MPGRAERRGRAQREGHRRKAQKKGAVVPRCGVQGMSDGSVQLWPLASYAVPHLGSRSPAAELRGHGGVVTCLLEHTAPAGAQVCGQAAG